MKNNNAEVVLIPPDEYLEITDALNDYLLLAIAVKRMESYDTLKVITEAEMDKRLGMI